MSTKKDCTNYEELLISRHILKDISKTNDNRLSAHLRRCEACRLREKDILFLSRASSNLPELKPSRNFEKNLFKTLEIPPLEKKKKTGLLARFHLPKIKGGMTFIKPAAAFFSVILIQAVLLRVYLLPPEDPGRSRDETSILSSERYAGSIHTGKKIRLADKNTRSRAAIRLEGYINRNKIRASVSTRISSSTITRKEPVPLQKKEQLQKAKTETQRNFLYSLQKKMQRQATPAAGARAQAISRKKKATVNKTALKEAPSDGFISQFKVSEKKKIDIGSKTTSVKANNIRNQKLDRLQKTKTRNLKTISTPGIQDSIQRKTVKKTRTRQAAPKFRTVFEKKKTVTVTLETDYRNRKNLQKLTPSLRRKIRGIYGKKTGIKFRYAFRRPAAKEKTGDKRAPQKKGRATLIILLIFLLEGCVRLLLLLDIRKKGLLTLFRGAAALLLGTLYLPFYLLRRER